MKDLRKKPPHVVQNDWDAVDVPEMTDQDFAKAKPLKDAAPELYESWKRGRGRPTAENPKVHINFRLASDLVDKIRASGQGYNSRVEKVLRDAVADGRFPAPAAHKS